MICDCEHCWCMFTVCVVGQTRWKVCPMSDRSTIPDL